MSVQSFLGALSWRPCGNHERCDPRRARVCSRATHRRELGYADGWLEEQGRVTVPSGRLQTPEDTAHVCVLLASDEGSQITATRFNVDGGLSTVM